jgi:hypothetical protein
MYFGIYLLSIKTLLMRVHTNTTLNYGNTDKIYNICKAIIFANPFFQMIISFLVLDLLNLNIGY